MERYNYVEYLSGWINESIGVEIAELKKKVKELRANRTIAKEKWRDNKNPAANSLVTKLELELAKTYGEIRTLQLQRKQEWENR